MVTGGASHKDITLVIMDTPDGPFSVLNVYNDSRTFDAVMHLLNHAQSLPPISMMVGDFNLRHASWDKQTQIRNENLPHGRNVTEVWDLAMELQLLLAKSEHGPATWQSNNTVIPAQTLDLLWYRGDYNLESFRVQTNAKHLSDHAPLSWNVVSQGSPPEIEANIKWTGPVAQAFCIDVAKLITSLPTQWESAEEIEQTGEMLFTGITSVWSKHAVKPNHVGRSKSWWNAECSEAAAAIRKARKARKLTEKLVGFTRCTIGSASSQCWRYVYLVNQTVNCVRNACKRLRAAARRAKRKFFDNILSKSHPQLISNFVSWAKPRRLDTSVQSSAQMELSLNRRKNSKQSVGVRALRKLVASIAARATHCIPCFDATATWTVAWNLSLLHGQCIYVVYIGLALSPLISILSSHSLPRGEVNLQQQVMSPASL